MASDFPDSQSILLYGGTVLTMDRDASVLHEAEILIDRGRIAAIGRALTAIPGTRVVDIQGSLVLPGLIQGHTHLGQTFFRGLAEGRKLLDWLRQRIWPLEAAHDDESAHWCTLLGAAECLLGGTTTVQDIGIGPGARGHLRALAESRLRAICGLCLMDGGEGLPAAMALDTDRALAETEGFGVEIEGDASDRLRYALNPRFILSCSDDLWRGLRDLSARHGWPIHTHALEQQEEVELVKTLKAGRDEIEYFDAEGILDTDLRIAHGIWLRPEHYPRFADRRFSVVHCPSSNLKLGSGIADVVGLRRAGIPVGIGCDGTACNNDLDAFEEMRLAALLQQWRNGPGSLSGVEALRLATSEGARALGLEDEIGSLEVGKRADLVVLSNRRPGTWSAAPADPHDTVVYGASTADVQHVFVDGEQLVDEGRLARLDLDHIRYQADRSCRDLLRRSGLSL